jgi:RNA polymerase sigma-70 factor (ECF subfamily)
MSPSDADRQQLEQELRRRAGAGDHAGTTTLALEGYGPEIFRFLHAIHRSDDETAEVFARFSEGLWRGLPSFDWGCTLRTWAYAVAQRTSLRYRRDEGRRAARHAPLPTEDLARVEQRVRTETLSYLRTERKSRLVALRDALPPEDRALLILRVDRGLEWKDLARALREDDSDQPLDEAALKREAARLRKRFQLVKERLLEMGRREGLVGGDR